MPMLLISLTFVFGQYVCIMSNNVQSIVIMAHIYIVNSNSSVTVAIHMTATAISSFCVLFRNLSSKLYSKSSESIDHCPCQARPGGGGGGTRHMTDYIYIRTPACPKKASKGCVFRHRCFRRVSLKRGVCVFFPSHFRGTT